MQATTRVLLPVIAALTLLACAQSPDKPTLNGYTCCNLHFENERISDANWSALPMLAAGTPASIVGYEKHRVMVQVAGRRMTLGLDYGRQQDIQGWAYRLIVPLDPRPRIAQWPALVREAVHHGKVIVGMTKEQVIASVGYPPAHETPSLDAPKWRYWHGKLDSYLVSWDESGRVKDVIAEPETRAAVMQQKANWLAKVENQPGALSGKQRAAMRVASVAQSVSVPDKPEVALLPQITVLPSHSTLMPVLDLLIWLGQKESASQTIQKFMTDNQIDLGEMVREEFTGALSQSQAFREVVADKGDARFELKVDGYGIGATSPGRDNAPFLQPFLRLTLEMTTSSGETVWRQSAGHASLEGLSDSTQVKEGFRRVAQVVARELVAALPSFGANALPPPAPIVRDSAVGARMTGQAVAPSAGPLPAAGTTWVYRFADRMFRGRNTEVTVQVVRANESQVEEAVTAAAPSVGAALRVIQAREPRIFEHKLRADVAFIEVAPYLLAAHDDTGVPQDLQATGYPMGQAGLGPWVIATRVMGWERVTVPAGSFQALRVEVNGHRNRDGITHGQVGRFDVVAWYSADVKRLIKLEHKTWSANPLNRVQVGHDVLELLAYRPPP